MMSLFMHSDTHRHNDHDRYLELCALATSGTLSDSEWADLKAHLTDCSECQTEIQQYRDIARTGMAMLMPERGDEAAQAQDSWSPELAKTELFERIARGDVTVQYRNRITVQPVSWMGRLQRWSEGFLRQPAYPLAVAIFCCAALAAGAYRWGSSGAYERSASELASTTAAGTSLKQQLDDLERQRASVVADLGVRAAKLNSLEADLKRQAAEVERWKGLQANTADELQKKSVAAATLQSDLGVHLAERDEMARRLQSAQIELQSVQLRYDNLRQERSQELLRTASLESRIDHLSAQLRESEAKAKQDEDFLANDRDVRDLMGARELHIADVFDVDTTGEKRAPYGRIFYTQGKSLIFYAFDLNQQPNLRDTSYFQAWGRRGIGDRRPLNMGVFYLDSVANKRWALKFDDPEVLAQIDAVFVTAELNKGSNKPSGKQLLFASLKTVANHP
jgi:hypothetical protein